MTREEKVQYWLDIADYDLDTAETLYRGGRWLYVAFMCHQVVEKTLKAYWTSIYNDDPPFTHSHTRLLNGCDLINKLSDEQLRFVTLLEPMYIEARYPEQKLDAAKMLNKEASSYILYNTKKMISWIEELL